MLRIISCIFSSERGRAVFFRQRGIKTYTSLRNAILGVRNPVLGLFYMLVLLTMLLCNICFADELKNVQGLLERSKKQAEHLAIPEIYNKETQEAAKDIAETYHSKEYQARLREESRKLRALLFSKETKDIETENPGQKSFLLPDERIYIFISSSIPISTLRNYAADLDKLSDPNIIMVMRGFVHGMHLIKPTINFISNILVKDSNCNVFTTRCDVYHLNIEVDPLLFARYRIETVPAILYARGVNSIDPDQSEGIKDNTSVADAYLVSGDVSLEYALEKIRKASKSSQIANILKELRRDFY